MKDCSTITFAFSCANRSSHKLIIFAREKFSHLSTLGRLPLRRGYPLLSLLLASLGTLLLQMPGRGRARCGDGEFPGGLARIFPES